MKKSGPSPSILILTAGFGDGHNSAARSIASAVERESGGSARVLVVDLFEDAAPITGLLYKEIYRQMINHWPGMWAWLFEWSKKEDFRNNWWDRFVGVQRALTARLAEFQPDAIVATYPIYPYFLESLGKGSASQPPIYMAVTDSITIHPIWLKSRVHRLYVTDELSRAVAERDRTQPGHLQVSGFPVAPVFADFSTRKDVGKSRGSDQESDGLRVLYFATTVKRHVKRTLRSLLEYLPVSAKITVVMGRHESRLSAAVQDLRTAYPAMTVITVGWCSEVPQLLMEQDIVISKAGGATVHECIAAGVPVIVNYVIPGQEEGNAQLLEELGCGCRCPDPDETGRLVASIKTDGRLAAMQRSMVRHRRPDGALRIARDLLQDYAAGTSSPGPVPVPATKHS